MIHFLLLLILLYVPVLGMQQWYMHVHGGQEPDEQFQIASLTMGQSLVIVGCLIIAKFTFTFGAGNGMGLNLRHPVRDLLWAVTAVLAVLPVVFGLRILCDFVVRAGAAVD